MQTQSDRNTTSSPFLLSQQVQMSSYAFLESHAEWLDVGALHGEAEYPSEALVNHQDLGRGITWALAIEAAAALGAYAIWHLFHVMF